MPVPTFARPTRRIRRAGGATLLLLLVSACGGGDEAADAEAAARAAVPEAGPPLQLDPLPEAERMGVQAEEILIALPWSETVVVKDPAPDAARATLRSVDVTEGPGFDRVTFTFGTDAPAPGYRVVWNDERTATCGGQPTTLPSQWTLLVGFEPATAQADGGRTTVEGTLRAGLPAVERVEQICDRVSRLTWALSAADSARVRVVELRRPPRLLVDVMHGGAAAGGAGGTAAP